jgi:hypothetical protein
MCDCPGDTLLPLPEERKEVEYETSPFWTYNLKYCDNPRRHIFGSCPQCWSLKVAKGSVDPRDLAIPLKRDNPLEPPLHLQQPQFSPIF